MPVPIRPYLDGHTVSTAFQRGWDQLKNGELGVLAYPDAFPNQGGVPIKVDGQTIGAIACSGAPSEVDEAISLAAVDALLTK